MDSLDHDLLTGETLDVGDKVTRRLSQEQATLPHPAAKSSGPIQSKQEIAAEAVKKMNCVPNLDEFNKELGLQGLIPELLWGQSFQFNLAAL